MRDGGRAFVLASFVAVGHNVGLAMVHKLGAVGNYLDTVISIVLHIVVVEIQYHIARTQYYLQHCCYNQLHKASSPAKPYKQLITLTLSACIEALECLTLAIL